MRVERMAQRKAQLVPCRSKPAIQSVGYIPDAHWDNLCTKMARKTPVRTISMSV